jgi:hypothetical protein
VPHEGNIAAYLDGSDRFGGALGLNTQRARATYTPPLMEGECLAAPGESVPQSVGADGTPRAAGRYAGPHSSSFSCRAKRPMARSSRR